MTFTDRAQIESRTLAVEQQIEEIEHALLSLSDTSSQPPDWLAATANRLGNLLTFPDLRTDFTHWLRRATSLDCRDKLSTPVQSWLHSAERGFLTTRGEAAQYLLEHISDKDAVIDKEVLRLAVILGLQYVVLHYIPGLREFRGSYLRSNLLPGTKLKAVRKSLRVPPKRGAVNWMTSYLLSKKPDPPGPFVVTLHDAALDLRGRVAAEDLVFGNRSVSGFVVRDALQVSISGYFFVSHPVPGLFIGNEFPSPFEEILGKIQRQNEAALASAIEADLVDAFGDETLLRSKEWNNERVPGVTTPPTLSLSSTNPTGFLAALRATPTIDPVGDVTSESTLDCQINEWPYIATIWAQLQLTCAFFDIWADQVAHHMQLFAELLESDGKARNGDEPRIAWLPQYRAYNSSDPQAFESLDKYYPEEVLHDLDRWMADPSKDWIEWHNWAMQQAERKSSDVTTQSHIRLRAALSVYSGKEASYTDLVVPILGRENVQGHERVVGFIRFNCYPGVRTRRAKPPNLHEELAKFRRLYQIVHKRLAALDQSLGALLARTDLRLRNLLASKNQPPIRAYKQATDAVRILADWIVSYLSCVLSGEEDDLPSFEIVKYVYEHIFEDQRQDVEKELSSVEATLEDFRNDLIRSLSELPEIPVVTFWLQTSQPVIEVTCPDQSSAPREETFRALADLFEHDPGLPQLMSYLSYTQAWHPDALKSQSLRSLCSRLRIGVHRRATNGITRIEVLDTEQSLDNFGYILDLGVSPKDVALKKLEIRNVEANGVRQRLRLHWQLAGEREYEVDLAWSWGSSPREVRFHPFPAAVRPVQGKVSRRIGTVISANVRAKIAQLVSQGHGSLISIQAAFEDLDEGFQKHIRDLEFAMLGVLERRNFWQAIPLTRGGYLFMLVSPEKPTPMVRAFRNVALSYERGAHLAWILGEQHYKRQSLAEQLAAVSHGYTGPVGSLRDELSSAKTRWGSQPVLDRGDVLLSAGEFILQASHIIQLGECAIAFAWRELDPPPKAILSGKQIIDDIREVVRAYQPRDKGLIAVSCLGEQQLHSFEVLLAKALFKHALSKLIDNAVKAAKELRASRLKELIEPTGEEVIIDVRTEGTDFLITIFNTGKSLSDERLKEIRQGLLEGEMIQPVTGGRRRLGLREAWECFRRLEIETDVRRPVEPPHVLAIELRMHRLRRR